MRWRASSRVDRDPSRLRAGIREAVRDALVEAGIGVDVAWSPGLRADGVHLEGIDPAAYTHLLFVCGPAHGRQVRQLHERFANCRRLAIGVSIVVPNDPAVTGFHEIIARRRPCHTDVLVGPPGLRPGAF